MGHGLDMGHFVWAGYGPTCILRAMGHDLWAATYNLDLGRTLWVGYGPLLLGWIWATAYRLDMGRTFWVGFGPLFVT